MGWVRYDSYTGKFICCEEDFEPVTFEITEEAIDKIANAVVRKLADHKAEPQTEIPCENCQEWDCYGCDYKQAEGADDE